MSRREHSEDLRAAFELQRSAARAHSPGYEERLRALRQLEQALLGRKVEIAKAISDDFGGRAVEETLALELFPLLNEIRYAIRHLRGWMAVQRAAVQWPFWPSAARVMYQPLGVVGILSTWNYPAYLSLAPAVGALAAGNHVLLKPSELAPATAEVLQRFVADIYSPEYVQVILGDAALGAQIADLPFDYLLFTGSARVGRLVMCAASQNLTPVTLELGGKSPAIVHGSYPMGKAAEKIVTAKLYNAGQTCVAPDYVLVPQDRTAEFVRVAQEVTARLYPRLVANSDYTRIVNVENYRRISQLVRSSEAAGAEVQTVNPGGELCDETNRVFPPTFVRGADDSMPIMQEEVFGPVLPVIGYDDLAHAISRVNGSPRPLALYYFDDDRSRVADVLRSTVSGGVTVNDCLLHVGQPALPFGGVGPSGMGRYHGFDGFQTFSNKKGVFLESRWSAVGVFRPPYGAKARRILDFLLRP